MQNQINCFKAASKQESTKLEELVYEKVQTLEEQVDEKLLVKLERKRQIQAMLKEYKFAIDIPKERKFAKEYEKDIVSDERDEFIKWANKRKWL